LFTSLPYSKEKDLGSFTKNVDCTVVGDAMIDISLPLSDVKDIYYLAEGGVTNTKMRLSPAGSANVAFYVTKLGGGSVFMGMVGDDYFGQIFLDDLARNGIRSSISISKGENTGVVFVLVFPDGQRFFIVDRGANAKLKYEDLNHDLIRDSKYFFLSGYSFQDKGNFSSILRLLGEITGDTNIVFNPSAPNLAQKYRDSFISVIGEYVNVLILNKAEAECLAEYNSEKEMIGSLLSLADVVALTKGDKGSIVAGQDEMYEIKANPVKVVDTTGAGDAYTGGFIYGLSRGWDIKVAGEFASKVATRVVSYLGARVDVSGLAL
jgi:sugar/nucleoside kinase (ribokinase family)